MEGVPQLESKMRREASMGRASGMQLHASLARKDLHLGLLKCDFSMEIVGIVQHLYTHMQFYLFFFSSSSRTEIHIFTHNCSLSFPNSSSYFITRSKKTFSFLITSLGLEMTQKKEETETKNKKIKNIPIH